MVRNALGVVRGESGIRKNTGSNAKNQMAWETIGGFGKTVP